MRILLFAGLETAEFLLAAPSLGCTLGALKLACVAATFTGADFGAAVEATFLGAAAFGAGFLAGAAFLAGAGFLAAGADAFFTAAFAGAAFLAAGFVAAFTAGFLTAGAAAFGSTLATVFFAAGAAAFFAAGAATDLAAAFGFAGEAFDPGFFAVFLSATISP
jgi:hypothetical protein